MADSFILTDGIFSIELLYNSASQAEYKILYGAQIQVDQPDVLMHQPDFGEPVPVRGINQDRTAFFNLHLPPNTDWDTVFNSVSVVKRAVDGADSQALRYWTDGDVNRVVLRIQLNGATNYTDIPVKFGVVDDSGSYYSPVAILNEMAYNVGVILTVSPVGEGTSLTLNNEIPSSPHFLEDSGAPAGLADGFSVLGTPSAAIDTDTYLIGGKSEEITTDASTAEGFFMTAYVTVAANAAYVAYVWVATLDSTGDDITITVQGAGSTQLAQATFDMATPAGYDKTAVGRDGTTWYRYSFSDDGSGPRAAADVRFRIGREAGDATKATRWYTDGMYIQSGTTTIPEAFCSTSALKNRYDPDVAEANINYLDFWGIPGDSDALLKLTNVISTSFTYTLITGKHDATIPTILESIYVFELEDMGSSGGGFGTMIVTADASRSGGSYIRQTNSGGTDGHSYNFPAGTANSIFQKTWRVFLLMRSSNTGNAFQVQLSSLAFDYVSNTNANTWELLDLGQVNGLGVVSAEAQALYVEALVVRATGTAAATTDVDCIFFVPVDDYLTVSPSGGVSTSLIINGETNETYRLDGSTESPLGKPAKLRASEYSRLAFLLHATDKAHALGDTFTIASTVTPRSRHLLGVQ